MKSLGFHLCFQRERGCSCPCPRPSRQKDRQQGLCWAQVGYNPLCCCPPDPHRGSASQALVADSCWWEPARALQTGDWSPTAWELGLWCCEGRTSPVPAPGSSGTPGARRRGPGGRNPLPARAGTADPVYHEQGQHFASANPSAFGINPTRRVILGHPSGIKDSPAVQSSRLQSPPAARSHMPGTEQRLGS